MISHFRPILLLALIITGLGVSAQIQVEKMLKYNQQVMPQLIDNYHYTVYYTNNKKAFNLKGFQIASPGGAIQDIKVNPAGYSYALLAGKWPKTKVTVHALNTTNIKRQVLGPVSPSAICYTPDSRRLIVADVDAVKFFDAKSLQQVGGFRLGGGTPLAMTASNNGYYLAVVYPARVDVYNMESGQLRHSFPTSGPGKPLPTWGERKSKNREPRRGDIVIDK